MTYPCQRNFFQQTLELLYDDHWYLVHCISWASTVRFSVQKCFNSSKHWIWLHIIDPFTYVFLQIANDFLNCKKYLFHIYIDTTSRIIQPWYVIGISFLEELSSSLQLAALRGKAILFGTRAESSAGIHGINSL